VSLWVQGMGFRVLGIKKISNIEQLNIEVKKHFVILNLFQDPSSFLLPS
jgi:hypothetical protein